MTNQYMTKLYHDLLSNSPQTVTIDIPADMGTGQISQVVYVLPNLYPVLLSRFETLASSATLSSNSIIV